MTDRQDAGKIHPAYEVGQTWIAPKYGPCSFTITGIGHKVLVGVDETGGVRRVRIAEFDGIGDAWILEAAGTDQGEADG